MKIILFILLVTSTQPAAPGGRLYDHLIEDPSGSGALLADRDIVDEWGTSIREGDGIYAASAHHKAILFYSRAALDRYLARAPVPEGTLLIDVRAGKQLRVEQRAVTKTVTESRTVTDHYDVRLREP